MFNYPITKRSTHSGIVVTFTALSTGNAIEGCKPYHSTNFTPHTDTSSWEDYTATGPTSSDFKYVVYKSKTTDEYFLAVKADVMISLKCNDPDNEGEVFDLNTPVSQIPHIEPVVDNNTYPLTCTSSIKNVTVEFNTLFSGIVTAAEDSDMVGSQFISNQPHTSEAWGSNTTSGSAAWEEDWSDSTQRKYYIEFDYENKDLRVMYSTTERSMGTRYMSQEQAVQLVESGVELFKQTLH